MWTVRRRWQALIALALVACMANLFGPAERWLGVDIGATGAAVFYLCLVGLLVLMALKGGEVFPDTWSLAERRAWVGMVVHRAHRGGYRKISLGLLAPRDRADQALRGARTQSRQFHHRDGDCLGHRGPVYWVGGRARSNTTNATCGCVFRQIGPVTGRSASPSSPV